MKISLKLAIGLMFVAGVAGSGSIASADQTRAVGVVAINYSGTTITSLSSAIAVGKTAAAGTASINGVETAASAIGGAGVLRVTNPNSTSVTYEIEAESAVSLGTTPTVTPSSQQLRIDSTEGTRSVTVVIP